MPFVCPVFFAHQSLQTPAIFNGWFEDKKHVEQMRWCLSKVPERLVALTTALFWSCKTQVEPTKGNLPGAESEQVPRILLAFASTWVMYL